MSDTIDGQQGTLAIVQTSDEVMLHVANDGTVTIDWLLVEKYSKLPEHHFNWALALGLLRAREIGEEIADERCDDKMDECARYYERHAT